jgi:hypothetical protein
LAAGCGCRGCGGWLRSLEETVSQEGTIICGEEEIGGDKNG